MTKYEYITNAYKIMEDDFTDRRKAFISSFQGLKESLYCSFVNFVNNYLQGYKYFNSWIDEITDEEVNRDTLTYEEALQLIIKRETNISLRADLCRDIIEYLRDNRNLIEYYI